MSFNGDLYPTAGADVVMTTKGDMVDYNTARQRLAIGSANQILQVKSNLPSWETLSTAGSVLTTQGDVLIEGAAGLERLGQSTDGFVLTTKGASANPVWATPTAGSMELLASQTLVGTGTDVTVSGTWLMSDYSYFIIKGGFSKNTAGAASMQFRINSSSAAVYVSNMILNSAGTLSATTSGMQTSAEICTTDVVQPASNETYQMVMTLELSEQGGSPSSGYRWNWSTTPMWNQSGAAPANVESVCGIFNNNLQNTLSNLLFYFSDGGDFNIGSNIQLYGVKRS